MPAKLTGICDPLANAGLVSVIDSGASSPGWFQASFAAPALRLRSSRPSSARCLAALVVIARSPAPVAWIPQPGPEYARILGGLIAAYEIRGNLVTDAQLAALAIEHGVPVCSNDTDFARFRELRWIDPLRATTGVPPP